MSGRHPVPTYACKAPACGAPITFLYDPERRHPVPVDPESLSEEDRDRIGLTGRSTDLDFDYRRHRRHRVTCKDQDFFRRTA